jgi:hypothetical protein
VVLYLWAQGQRGFGYFRANRKSAAFCQCITSNFRTISARLVKAGSESKEAFRMTPSSFRQSASLIVRDSSMSALACSFRSLAPSLPHLLRVVYFWCFFCGAGPGEIVARGRSEAAFFRVFSEGTGNLPMSSKMSY